MSRAPSDGSTSICNKPPYVFPPPPAAEPTAPPAFLSPYFPLHPRSFHPFSPSPPVSTSTLIPDFCLHPRFVHAFSCRRSAPTAPTLSTPFPRSFRETVQLSSRFEPLFFAVSFREKAGQGERGAGKEGRKEGRIEKVGLDWVLLKGGNALFKCSPREHTEDKTAPRRRIRRVNRHTTLPSSSFSLLFINCCYREGGGRARGNFLAATRCAHDEERARQSCSICFCISCTRERKWFLPSTMNRSGIPIRESLESTISSLTLRNVLLLHYALRRIAFLNHRVGEWKKSKLVIGQLEAAATFGRGFSLLYERWGGFIWRASSCESAWIMRIYERKGAASVWRTEKNRGKRRGENR